MGDYIYGEMTYSLPDATDAAQLFENMTMEQYHDLGDYTKHGENFVVGRSMLCDIGCPAKFNFNYMTTKPDEKEDEKPCFGLGRAVHTLALEPALFHDFFYVLPETYPEDFGDAAGKKVIRNKAHKAYQKLLEEVKERTILTASNFADIKGMAKSLAGNKKARALLEGVGKIESSIFWKDEETGLNLKVRPDWMRDDGLIVNLKSCANAEPNAFFRSAFDHKYDMGAAMESDAYKKLTGKTPDNYALLAVESKAPYVIEVYDTYRPWDSSDMTQTCYYDVGKFRYRRALATLAECLKTNIWGGYNRKIIPMAVPGYEMKKMENLND